MSTQSLTLRIPEPLYQHIKHRAEQAHRSVEEETLELLATAVPSSGNLSVELLQELESLQSLDDSRLWQIARSRFPTAAAGRLQALHEQCRRGRLNLAESEERLGLIDQYERHMVCRAQAAALLQQRGHDVHEIVRS